MGCASLTLWVASWNACKLNFDSAGELLGRLSAHMGDSNVIFLQEAGGWPSDDILHGWRLIHQINCPSAVLISPSLRGSIEWMRSLEHSVAVIVHGVLHISMYLPDCTYPFQVYLRVFQEVEELIGCAQGIGFMGMYLGGDLNVELPEVEPFTGPQACGRVASVGGDVTEHTSEYAEFPCLHWGLNAYQQTLQLGRRPRFCSKSPS